MTRAEIIRMQERIGTIPDGFWGPKSIAACQAHLRTLMAKAPQEWPKSDQASLRAFYGAPGDENNLVSFTFPYPIYYEGKLVKSSRCHKKVKDSLLRVLNSIGDRWKNNRGIMEEAEDYGGIYNYRTKRGGSSWSLHAFGAAIDMDADDNGMKDAWPVKADMPLEIMEAFAKEGWLCAGAFWGYDAMHFQATK